MESSTEGSAQRTGWKRRSRAAAFSICLRYSSRVVAPTATEFPPGQGGLEKVGGVHRALGRAPAPTRVWSSSMKRMTWPSDFSNLLDDGLEALLELAPELGARDEGPEVQGKELLAAQ